MAKGLEFLRRNINVLSTIGGILITCLIVVWNSGRNYQSLETKITGLQSQIVEVKGIVEKQDVRINGHEARLREAEALKYSIDSINKSVSEIFGKLGAADARLGKLEDLVKINEQVRINTGRIDRLETFMMDSVTDRAKINTKLDQIQNAFKDFQGSLDKLTMMHLQK